MFEFNRKRSSFRVINLLDLFSILFFKIEKTEKNHCTIRSHKFYFLLLHFRKEKKNEKYKKKRADFVITETQKVGPFLIQENEEVN